MTNKTLLGGTVTAWTIFRQYVYGPLGGVSVPANVSWTLWARASEAAATVNANPRVALRVESAAGVTRGTIATPTTTASGAEFGTTLTSRGFHPTTPTSSGFSIQGGDYLVLEVGVVQSSPTAGNISINFGDDSASNLTTLNVATADNPVLVIDVDLRLFSGGARAFILD